MNKSTQPKPMRDVSKKTPKAGSDGPPSSLPDPKRGPKQTQGKTKIADRDMMDQKSAQKKQPVDPFKELVNQSSRNARYTMPGYVDTTDILSATDDEHEDLPRRRRMA